MSKHSFIPSGSTARLIRVKATCLVCLLALSGAAPWGKVHAGEADVLELSLEGAIGLAMRNNRELVQAHLERVSERFALRVAENKFRPHITLGSRLDRTYTAPSRDIHTLGVSSAVALRIPTGGAFGVGWTSGHRTGEVASRSRYANELKFTFEQPLLRGAGVQVNTASVHIARRIEEINLLTLRQTIIEVVFRVTEAYRAYMQAGHRVEIRTQSLKRARDLLAVNELLVRTGRMAERDIVQTEADIANRELQLIRAQNRLDAARLALTDILDIDSTTPIRLTDSLDDVLKGALEPMDPAHSLETALHHRPDHQRAILRVDIAETAMHVADNERLWDLSANLTASFSGSHESFGSAVDQFDNTDYSAWLNLSIPIGAGTVDPRKQRQVAAAIDLRQARVSLANVRQHVEIEVSNALREVELSHQQVELARAARELVESKVQIEKEKLRLGLTSNFRLVAFEEDLVSALDHELDAGITYHGALSAFYRSLGTTLERWGLELDDSRWKDAGAVP